jgi:glycosyltransferase involved in cell wall biosynthesis
MKCSIITANYNRIKTIERSINSLHKQSYKNIEHIFIDGFSLDGSKELILSRLRKKDKFVSEFDFGIYDALNKGIKISTGEVIAFLHTDDVYASNKVVEKVMNIFLSEDVDLIYGDATFFREHDFLKDIRFYKSGLFSKSRLSWGWMPAHPAIFIKKSVYEKHGLFKTSYKIAADYEFLCRIASDSLLKTKYIPKIFIRMQMGGVSTSGFKNTLILNREVLRACHENQINTNLFKILSKYPLKIAEKCSVKKFF